MAIAKLNLNNIALRLFVFGITLESIRSVCDDWTEHWIDSRKSDVVLIEVHIARGDPTGDLATPSFVQRW
jgi:hypothetical protein